MAARVLSTTEMTLKLIQLRVGLKTVKTCLKLPLLKLQSLSSASSSTATSSSSRPCRASKEQNNLIQHLYYICNIICEFTESPEGGVYLF